MPSVVVVTGGGPLAADAVAAVPHDATVIAADSGAEHALAAGLDVDVVVGDLDSVAPRALARLEAGGVEIERHPAAKDQTDLELALARARRGGPGRIVVIGGDGGRLDHVLANVATLVPPVVTGDGASPEIEAWFGPAHVQLATPAHAVELRGQPGSVVSLLALHGPVRAVRTQGLRWALAGEDLAPGVGRGLSNQLLGGRGRVEVRDGALVVVQPGPQL